MIVSNKLTGANAGGQLSVANTDAPGRPHCSVLSSVMTTNRRGRLQVPQGSHSASDTRSTGHGWKMIMGRSCYHRLSRPRLNASTIPP